MSKTKIRSLLTRTVHSSILFIEFSSFEFIQAWFSSFQFIQACCKRCFRSLNERGFFFQICFGQSQIIILSGEKFVEKRCKSNANAQLARMTHARTFSRANRIMLISHTFVVWQCKTSYIKLMRVGFVLKENSDYFPEIAPAPEGWLLKLSVNWFNIHWLKLNSISASNTWMGHSTLPLSSCKTQVTDFKGTAVKEIQIVIFRCVFSLFRFFLSYTYIAIFRHTVQFIDACLLPQ